MLCARRKRRATRFLANGILPCETCCSTTTYAVVPNRKCEDQTGNKVFAFLPNYVGLENIRIFCETDELPNPGPNQPKKIRLKVAVWPHFHTTNYFRGLGLILYRKQTTKIYTSKYIYIGNRLPVQKLSLIHI